MTLTAFFQYRLSIAQQKGYPKAIQFEIDPLAGAPLPTQAPVCPTINEGERSGRPLKRRFVSGPGMTARAQRASDKARQARKRRSPEFFRQAKAQLQIVWPVNES